MLINQDITLLLCSCILQGLIAKLRVGNKTTRRHFPIYQHHQRLDCESKIIWNQVSLLDINFINFLLAKLYQQHRSCMHIICYEKDLQFSREI